MPWRVKVCQGSKWLWSGFLLSIQDQDLQPPRLWKAKSWSSASAMRFRHGHAMARVKVGKQRQNLPRSTWSCTVGLLGMMVENWTFTSESRSESAGCDLDAFLILSADSAVSCFVAWTCIAWCNFNQRFLASAWCERWSSWSLVAAWSKLWCQSHALSQALSESWLTNYDDRENYQNAERVAAPIYGGFVLLDRLFRRFWIAKPWPACLFLRHPCGMKLARIQLLLTMILDDFSFAMRHVTCLRSWKPLHIMSSPGEALDNCPPAVQMLQCGASAAPTSAFFSASVGSTAQHMGMGWVNGYLLILTKSNGRCGMTLNLRCFHP